MFRFVAPAGSPIKFSQILGSLKRGNSPNGMAREWQDHFATSLQAHRVYGTSSGRAALWLILEALRRLRPDRSVVALPAYTCFTVPAAVVRSGLQLHPVDINPVTLDLDLSQLKAVPENNLLCVIGASLFGFVNDFPQIGKIARAKGAFVIDDAAQALGATRGGVPAGTFGDVGLYSFGRGKTVPAIEGGMIVTASDEIGRAIREVGELPRTPLTHECRLALELVIYSLFLRPRCYWIPNSLPFLKLGITEFVPNFPVSAMPYVVEQLLPQLLPHLSEDGKDRRGKAALLAAALGENSLFTLPHPASDCVPNYVRFPVIAREAEVRDLAVKELQKEGIGASPYYAAAICDIPGIESFMGPGAGQQVAAEQLARQLFTLPTHNFVERHDIERMIHILKRL